jgi:hypothetical protein
MRKLAVGIALVGTCLVATGTFAQADGEFHARSVNRGLEEPGKYSPANLFDGDASTEFCALPGQSAELVVYLSQADRMALREVTSIRVSAKTPHAVAVNLDLPHSGGLGLTAVVNHGVGELPYRLEAGGNGAAELRFHAEWFDKNKHPVCLSELTFLGAHGPIALPSIAVAVGRAHERQARLSKLGAKTKEFARTYLTLFRWMLPPAKGAAWESESFSFADNGTFSVEKDGTSEKAKTGTWSVSNDGQQLSLQEGNSSWTYSLGGCNLASGNLCLSSGSQQMVTAADW